MKKLTCAAALFALAACDTATSPTASSTSAATYSGAAAALFALPVEDYYKQVSLARVTTDFCPNLKFNRRLDLEMNEDRNREGRGSFSVVTRVREVRANNDAFLAAYARDRNLPLAKDSGWCAAGRRELAAASPASALIDG
ncbi:MAG: hypothetical protein AAGF60_07440 [Pseudomonadota bacterium]